MRLRQTFHGHTVWGADVVVHASATDLIGITGTVAPVQNLAPLDMTMVLSPEEALSRAKSERFGSRADVVQSSRETSERVVVLDEDGAPHLGIHTSFFVELQLQGSVQPALWHHIVNAKTGQ